MPIVPEVPRPLSPRERALLLWVLPADRPGYQMVRELLDTWMVAGPGKTGPGHSILAPPGVAADPEAPLSPVLAVGVVETTQGTVTVTVRERMGDRLDVDISGLREDQNGVPAEERRRWTYSTWLPGLACPACGGQVREVRLPSAKAAAHMLVFCVRDERLWVHDSRSLVNHPIPVTNFYNELMLHRGIRDPRVALEPRLLFARLDTCHDRELIAAFRSYNRMRTRVELDEPEDVPRPGSRTVFSRMLQFFRRSHGQTRSLS